MPQTITNKLTAKATRTPTDLGTNPRAHSNRFDGGRCSFTLSLYLPLIDPSPALPKRQSIDRLCLPEFHHISLHDRCASRPGDGGCAGSKFREGSWEFERFSRPQPGT